MKIGMCEEMVVLDGVPNAEGMGTLNVLDLVFTPFPQCFPKIRIKRFLVGKRLTCPYGEILKTSYITEQNQKQEYLPCHSDRPLQGQCPHIGG